MTDSSSVRTLKGVPSEPYDIVIVGTGAGGGTLAYALRDTGRRVLMVERGGVVPQEPENWDVNEVFRRGRYRPDEWWLDGAGRPFKPGVHYLVGGNTKVYGASLPRFRRSDFGPVDHDGWISPAWPYSYDDLAPFYDEAERIFHVHGADDDPTLVRQHDYPFPAVPHEPAVQALADKLQRAGYTPSHIPLGIDLRDGGRCIRCATCDGFPCRLHAKADADVCCVRPALERETVDLLTRSYVRRIVTNGRGDLVTGIEVEHDGACELIRCSSLVVSCGAVNSAALLLRSATNEHPDGLANKSGAVGRHYMAHNNSAMLWVDPVRRNPTIFQKTLYINDFYEPHGRDHRHPLGSIQMIGKVQKEMMAGRRRYVPSAITGFLAARSFDWWLFSEDAPDPDNRVVLGAGSRIIVRWTPNNQAAHRELIREARRMARTVGLPVVFTERFGIEVNSHQAGTARAGHDPAASVLDPDCRSHEVANLFVVDSSFFPSLPLMNPALTIAANALRVAPHVAATV
jgi:choline dehydrogenase-like flavoprotein